MRKFTYQVARFGDMELVDGKDGLEAFDGDEFISLKELNELIEAEEKREEKRGEKALDSAKNIFEDLGLKSSLYFIRWLKEQINGN
jgi:hypothetical protein